MSNILRLVKGKVIGRGIVTYSGRYLVYEHLTIEEADKNVVRIESVAMIPKMGVAIGQGVAFQFADSKEFNTVYKHHFLVGVQQKDEQVVTDALILKSAAKARKVLAFISLIPPLTVIAPYMFRKAMEIREAYRAVGVFEHVEKNFIKKMNRKNF